jgi:hypothetical protein
MFRLISIISALLFTIPHISAQGKFDKDWRIGLTIPIMHAELHQKQMWTGISAAYKGYTINFYGVFSNNILFEGNDEFLNLVSQPWKFTPRLSLGYSYMFGSSKEADFNPIV